MNGRKSATAKKAAANRNAPVTSHARAGLIMGVPRVMRMMKNDRLNARVGKGPGVIMAAVLEYICAEIIEVSYEQAKTSGRHRIKPRDIQLALSQDPELGRLCVNSIISEGGRPVHIEPELLKKKGGKAIAEPTQEM